MATKKFPSEISSRGTVKVTDKLMIQNIDSGETCYTTVAELFTALVVKGAVSCLNNTATTLFTLPGDGMYHVYTYIDGYSDPALLAYAVILKEGTEQRICIQNDETAMFITLSGANVQGRQGTGITNNINYAYRRVI